MGSDIEMETGTVAAMETSATGTAPVEQHPFVEPKTKKGEQEAIPMTTFPMQVALQATLSSRRETASMASSTPATDGAIAAIAAASANSATSDPNPLASTISTTETTNTATTMLSQTAHATPSGNTPATTASSTTRATALPFPAPERTFSAHLPNSIRGVHETAGREQPAKRLPHALEVADSQGSGSGSGNDKQKGKGKDGTFAVLRMSVGTTQSAQRSEAAKRTSEDTQAAAKLASKAGYQSIKRSRLVWHPQEQPTQQHSQASANPNPNPNPTLPHDPRQPPPTWAAPPGGLLPQGIKMEQARLLTLLRSLHPVAVVDQMCKALAYFGGIPGAPALPDESFPESARVNGSGSLFISWMSEIFPHVDAAGNAIHVPRQLSMYPPTHQSSSMAPPPPVRDPPPPPERRPKSSLLRPLPGQESSPKPPKRPRGRPKGSKSKTPRKDKGVKKGPKAPSTNPKSRNVGLDSKKMGRPKGSRNLPKDLILDPEQWPDLLKTATVASTVDPGQGPSAPDIVTTGGRAAQADEASAPSRPSTSASSPDPGGQGIHEPDESDEVALVQSSQKSAGKNTENEPGLNATQLTTYGSFSDSQGQSTETRRETEPTDANGESRKRQSASEADNNYNGNMSSVVADGLQLGHHDGGSFGNKAPYQTAGAKRRRVAHGTYMSGPELSASPQSSTTNMQLPSVNPGPNRVMPSPSQDMIYSPESTAVPLSNDAGEQHEQQQTQHIRHDHKQGRGQHGRHLLDHRGLQQQPLNINHPTTQRRKQATPSAPGVPTGAGTIDTPNIYGRDAKYYSKGETPATLVQQPQQANHQHAFARSQPSISVSSIAHFQGLGDRNYIGMGYELGQKDLRSPNTSYIGSASLGESTQLEAALSEPEMRERLYRAIGRP